MVGIEEWLRRVAHDTGRMLDDPAAVLAALDDAAADLTVRAAQEGRDLSPALASAGIPVGVVSDIGWDIRTHATDAGLDHLVGTWVLSREAGREKPAPELFLRVCADVDVDPRATVMVGDSPARDGGAVAAGVPAAGGELIS